MTGMSTKNSFLVPHDTLENPKFLELSSCCFKLYITLCKIYNRMEWENNKPLQSRWFYHSIEQLSDKSKMDVKSVIKAKKLLNENHFIDIQKGFYVNGRLKSADYFRINGFRMRNDEKAKFENYQ
jgi:hypothetical protein